MPSAGLIHLPLGRLGRRFLRDAVRPHPAAGWIAAGCLTFLTAGSVLRLPPMTPMQTLAGPLAVLLGTLIAVVSHRIALSLGERRGAAVVMVLGFGAAEVARTLTYDAMVIGVQITERLGHSLLAGALTGIASMGVVTALVVGSHEYRTQRARLLASRAGLSQLIERAREESRRDRDRLLVQTRRVLGRALKDALREGEQSGDAAGAMVQLVESTIRPLGRRLNDLAAPTELLEVPESSVKEVSPRGVLSAAVSTVPFDVLPLLVLTTLLAAGSVTFWEGAGGALGGWLWLLSVLATVSMGFMAARFLLERPLSRLPLLPRTAGVVAAHIAVVLAGSAVDAAWRDDDSASSQLYLAILVTFLSLAVVAIRGLAVARLAVLDELATTNDRIRLVAGRTAVVLWSAQRALARAVHRDIQAATIAATWRYTARATDPSTSQQALQELQRTIREAVAALSLDPHVPSTADLVQSVRATWEGICDVTVDIAPVVMRELDADTVGRRVVGELLGELVTNAVKHGHARRASATLGVIDDASLELRFWNDGAPVDREAGQGMGMREVLRRSLAVTVENQSDGVMFRLVLPR